MKRVFNQLKFFKVNSFALAVTFCLFLLGFETIFLQNDYFAYFQRLGETSELAWRILGCLITFSAIACFFIFAFYAFSSSRFYKAVYFAIFSFAVFYEYGYQKALGRFSNLADVEAIFSATSNQRLTAIFYYFNFLAVIPCLLFLVFLCLSKSSKPQKTKGLVMTFLLLGTFFFSVSYLSEYYADRRFPTFSLNAFCRSASDFVFLSDTFLGTTKVRRHVERAELSENYRPDKNIILIVDESVTGSHLSINGYKRPTTPFLEELARKGVLQNWGVAAAATTSSHTTYDVLISGATPDDMPEKKVGEILKTSPTLFQYAKAANYRTTYFDGQVPIYWGGIADDTNYIDQFVGVDKFSGSEEWEIDNRIAQKAKEIVENSTGNFIFIFKRGSHLPYHKNFPEEAEIWKPSFRENILTSPPSDKIYQAVNGYDNALRYNIDSFFQNLISDYENLPPNTFIFYTSDHGQTLFANGRASHAGNTKIEADVPLFLIGAPGLKLDTNYRASHSNLFATILDLMNYPKQKRARSYALSLLTTTAADNQPRYFNPSLGEKVPFD